MNHTLATCIAAICAGHSLAADCPTGNAAVTLPDAALPAWHGDIHTVGDFNADGNSDVIVGDFVIFFGDDNGTFSAKNFYNGSTSLNLALRADAQRVVDITGDGIPDLVGSQTGWLNGTLTPNPAYTAVVPGIAPGQYDPASTTITFIDDADNDPAPLAKPYAWTVGQAIDGPEAELIFIDLVSHNACVWQYPFAPDDLRLTPLPHPANYNFSLNNMLPDSVAAIADFSGDGYDDIVYLRNTEPLRVYALLSDGNGGFTDAGNYNASDTIIPRVSLKDMNNDGRLDLILAGRRPDPENPENAATRISVLLGDGNGTFASPTISVLNDGQSINAGVSFHDLTDDGILDIAYIHDGALYIHPGQSHGFFSDRLAVCIDPASGIDFSQHQTGHALEHQLTFNAVHDSRRFSARIFHVSTGFSRIERIIDVPALEFACLTDLTGDFITDAADLAVLLAAWGAAGDADLNGSGAVDAADLAVLLAAWGGC